MNAVFPVPTLDNLAKQTAIRTLFDASIKGKGMKLYYTPGTCALAPHIVANETGLQIELVKVDLAGKKTETGDDYLAISPNGYVPALAVDDGEALTEASLIVQYLADLKPESGLMPAAGTMERYRVQQTLSFIATELHKAFSPFFKPGTPEQIKIANREHLQRRIGYLDGKLERQTFLAGETFTAADAYLWSILSWAKYADLDLSRFVNIQRFMSTVARRPAVQKALREQGLT